MSREDEAVELPEPTSNRLSIIDFPITLGPTYYIQGFINPGTAASEKLGKDGEAIRVELGDSEFGVTSQINRTANPNGSVRILGRNRQIAEWFQKYFKPKDTVKASVIDPNRIFLHLP